MICRITLIVLVVLLLPKYSILLSRWLPLIKFLRHIDSLDDISVIISAPNLGQHLIIQAFSIILKRVNIPISFTRVVQCYGEKNR